MNDNNKTTITGGVGFCELLTVAFVVLKLCGIINWSWVWVLAPLWIPLSIITIFLIIFLIIVLLK